MAIDVVCTSCKTRFQVSEKFAGKKGPCPKCKSIITVPELKDQVVVHAPEASGPKDSKGVSVLKPIARTEARLSVPMIVGIALGVLTVLLAALAIRISSKGTGDVSPVILIAGAILLAPPLALAGYTFLRDDELEPHRGMSLILRLIPISIVYPALWGVYWLVFGYLGLTPELMHLIVVIPAVIAAGAVAAQASLDLEIGAGALHFTMYLVATVILRLIMGMEPHWHITGGG